MKNNVLSIMLLVAVSIGNSGCHKDDHDHDHNKNDKEAPKIEIHKPSQATYAHGDTIWMDVTVTDNEDLHEVKWWLIKLPADTVYQNKRHQHAKTVRIENTYYVLPQSQDHADYIFTVKAEDDNENTTIKSHEFHVD
jgi:hypothetical protein